MQLDDTEEDLKGQHDQEQGPDSPNGSSEDTHYFDMNFQQLCETNEYGGDPRLYEKLKQALLEGLSEQDEEMAKLFGVPVLKHLTSKIGNKNALGIREDAKGRLYFCGFPDFDCVRQLNTMLHLWHKMQLFPVNFVRMQGFKDETDSSVYYLNTLTHLVVQVFDTLRHSNVPQLHFAVVRDLLMNMEPRGIYTLLGMRKTAGSQEIAWPQLSLLKETYNQPHTTWTEEQRMRIKNPASQLTVGARALTKHCHRSSEGFWGLFRGSELQKNNDANEKLKQILTDCVWINIHKLNHNETIVECRIEQGYGMRWTGEGVFRGFLEPQMDDGHKKGWRH